ncbi:hypothetical protein DRH27_01955 [Candidatus Falkowbacteria bacterium]|nr:MAG: hypothetical protein DRH27_01955 [Candidatus Falkowbacteria bacterium]
MEEIKDNKGLTLVETVIYTALIGIVISGFISYSLVIVSLKNKNYVIEEVNNSSRNVLTIVSKKVKQARAIISPAKGATSSVLIIEMSGGATSSISSINNIVKYSTSSLTQNITSGHIEISDLVFNNLSSGGEKDNIRLTFTASYKEPGSKEYMYEENLQTAVAIR